MDNQDNLDKTKKERIRGTAQVDQFGDNATESVSVAIVWTCAEER